MRELKREEINPPSVIFENNNFLVIAKPSGWIVNDAETAHGQPTIQNWLAVNFNYSISRSPEFRSGIVHRLDKETSGVLLIAKTRDYFTYLQSLFKERKITKSYIALLHGRLQSSQGVIEAEVGRLPWNKKRFGVLPGGRGSKTAYKAKTFYKLNNELYSLVTFYPETGRTHQIRIHAKHIGHPVVGDTFYAGRKTARADRSWCPRLFLHAQSIRFVEPGGKEVEFTSALPAELTKALTVLEKVQATK